MTCRATVSSCAGPRSRAATCSGQFRDLARRITETQVLQAGTFVEAIAAGKQPDTDFAHGYRIQEIMETMLASAQSGQWTPVSYRLQQ